MTVFNEIRTTLIDPSLSGQTKRQEVAEKASDIKRYSGLAMGGLGLITVISLFAMRTFPIMGGIFATLGAVGTVGAHEAMVIAGNTAEMANGEGALGNVTTRASAAYSESRFTKRVTQDTWVAGPLFADVIENGLKKSQG